MRNESSRFALTGDAGCTFEMAQTRSKPTSFTDDRYGPLSLNGSDRYSHCILYKVSANSKDVIDSCRPHAIEVVQIRRRQLEKRAIPCPSASTQRGQPCETRSLSRDNAGPLPFVAGAS